MPAFDVGTTIESLSLAGYSQVTLTNVAGDTLYYDSQPNVTASANSGSLTAGQSATFTEPMWIVSASRTNCSTLFAGIPSSSPVSVSVGDSRYVRAARHASRLGGLFPIAVHPQTAQQSVANEGNLSNGTDTSGTFRTTWLTVAAGGDLCLAFSGFAAQADNPNSYTVNAAFEFSTGALIPVTFNGQATVTVAPGGLVVSDPVGVTLAAGTQFWTRSYVTVTTGNKWPTVHNQASGRGEANNRGTGADLTTSTGTTNLTTTATELAFAPTMVLSGSVAANLPIVLGIGDSLIYGYQDPGGGTSSNFLGFLERALAGAYPYISLAKFGETAQAVNPATALSGASTTRNIRRRVSLYSSGTHAVDNYGINDVSGSRTLAQLQADVIGIWTALANRGVKVYRTTLTPKTTSTDNWATTANQTVNANDAVRTQFNDWIRGGAPMSGGAAVAVGSSGALLAGQTGHPLVGYFETADTVESARNSGLWKVNGSANGYTADGTHPSAAGYAAMAAAVNTAVFTA